MLNPRLLLQIPLFLLGSCNAMSPQSTINIYTADLPRGTMVTPGVDTAHITLPQTPHTPPLSKTEKCAALELAQLQSYILPPLPHLPAPSTESSADDYKLIVDVLFDALEVHRKEIKRLQNAYKCTLEGR